MPGVLGEAAERRHGLAASLTPRSPRNPFSEEERHRRLCHGPHQVFPGPAKVFHGKCPRSLCGSPSRDGGGPRGAAGQGHGAHTCTAEPSLAEPHLGAPLVPPQARLPKF